MAHLGDDVNGPAPVVRHLDAGPHGVGSHEPVCDHGVKPCGEDRVADEAVGVRDIRNLEVGDERQPEAGKVLYDPEAGREDERVADLDRVDIRCTGLRNARRLPAVAEIEREDEFGHPSSLSRVAATRSGRLMVASP